MLTMFLVAQLAAAQQYSLVTSGYPPLHRWAKSHMLSMHSPPAGVHDLIMTNGNNQTIEVRKPAGHDD